MSSPRRKASVRIIFCTFQPNLPKFSTNPIELTLEQRTAASASEIQCESVWCIDGIVNKYVGTALRIVRTRLVQAGVRLGRLLDNAFSDCPTFVSAGRPTDQRMVLPERKPWSKRPISIYRSQDCPTEWRQRSGGTCLHWPIRYIRVFVSARRASPRYSLVLTKLGFMSLCLMKTEILASDAENCGIPTE
jgi:hypothetical protein